MGRQIYVGTVGKAEAAVVAFSTDVNNPKIVDPLPLMDA